MTAKQPESSEILIQILEQLRKMEKEQSEDSVNYMFWKEARDEHIQIRVRISIVSVGEIDAVRQEFQCEFYMKMSWAENKLEGVDISDNANIDWDAIWDPGVYIIDVVNFDVHERRQSAQPPKCSGEPPQVVVYYHIKGTFKEVLELNNFPFDYQDLSLTLTSNWHADKVTFVKNHEQDDNIHTWNFYSKQEWNLRPHVITEPLTLEPTEGSSSNRYPQYRIRINVMRQYKFYIYNVFLIMFLITALTFASFAVKADSPGDRIQITLTLLLTTVAFKYYVQQFVPTVSYLTVLDKYVISCMVFQFFSALQNVISSLITSPVALSVFEWISFGTEMIAFLVLNSIFGFFSLIYIRAANSQMIEDREEYIRRNPGQMKYR